MLGKNELVTFTHNEKRFKVLGESNVFTTSEK